MEYFKIGKLAKLSGSSVKSLRFYDEIGVLEPAMVDKETNYRYYDNFSLDKVLMIKVLKDLGFSLMEIKNFDIKNLPQKAHELEIKVDEIKHNISLLKNIKSKEDLTMFVRKQSKIAKLMVLCSCGDTCKCGCDNGSTCTCGK